MSVDRSVERCVARQARGPPARGAARNGPWDARRGASMADSEPAAAAPPSARFPRRGRKHTGNAYYRTHAPRQEAFEERQPPPAPAACAPAAAGWQRSITPQLSAPSVHAL